MYWRILRKDLKRKKTMNFVLLLFILLAAMFIASGGGNMVTIFTALDDYFEMAGVPDYWFVFNDIDNKGKYEDFVLDIVNDRNFYTHSSNREKAKLSIRDAMNVAVLCKEIYRILVLSKMGMPVSAVCCRLVHNRTATELFNSMLKIEIVHDTDIPEFDNAMLGFDDNK